MNNRPNRDISMYQREYRIADYGTVNMRIRSSTVAGKKLEPERERAGKQSQPLYHLPFCLPPSLDPPSTFVSQPSSRPSLPTSLYHFWISDCWLSSDSSTDNECLVSSLSLLWPLIRVSLCGLCCFSEKVAFRGIFSSSVSIRGDLYYHFVISLFVIHDFNIQGIDYKIRTTGRQSVNKSSTHFAPSTRDPIMSVASDPDTHEAEILAEQLNHKLGKHKWFHKGAAMNVLNENLKREMPWAGNGVTGTQKGIV